MVIYQSITITILYWETPLVRGSCFCCFFYLFYCFTFKKNKSPEIRKYLFNFFFIVANQVIVSEFICENLDFPNNTEDCKKNNSKRYSNKFPGSKLVSRIEDKALLICYPCVHNVCHVIFILYLSRPGFEPRSGKSKDYVIVSCCFSVLAA